MFVDGKLGRLAFWRVLWECARGQWSPAHALRAVQDQRLCAVLLHAATRVAVYRSLYAEARADVGSVRSAEDL